MPFFALFPLFWGVRKHFAHTLGQGGVQCTSPKLCGSAPATIVQKQSRCEGPESAGNGQKRRFLHFCANCWGFRARWGPGIVPICPQWACGVPWGMLQCQRLVGGQPKWQGLGRKLPKMAHKWPFLHPSSPPWLGLVGQWQVLCCLCWGGICKGAICGHMGPAGAAGGPRPTACWASAPPPQCIHAT